MYKGYGPLDMISRTFPSKFQKIPPIPFSVIEYLEFVKSLQEQIG